MSKQKILIVEDDDVLSGVIIDNLAQAGFSTVRAKDGEEGLFMSLEEKPDLILLDILLPTMDGLTVLKKLREDEWGKNVKVMMLTNLGDAENISKAIKQGSFDYILKSGWKIEDIVEKVKER